MQYNQEDLELLLLLGEEIDIGIGKIYPLKLKEIAKLGYSKYNYYVSLLLIDKSRLETNEDLSQISNFEIIYGISLMDEQFRKNYFNMLEVFFKETVSLGNGFFYFGELCEDKQRIIHKDNFHIITNIIKKMNFIKEPQEEKYNPGNDEARKFIEELKKKKQAYANVNKVEEINLYSIISSIAWKSNIGINSIKELTVYQLYDAYYRLGLIDNYDKTMHGIYAGTIDNKKINLKDLNWSKVINQ